MARVELAAAIVADFERILDHLDAHRVDKLAARIDEILAAISILEGSPYVGRITQRGRRELVIGRSFRGYVALYRFVPEIDTVFVLAIRSQCEAGYAGASSSAGPKSRRTKRSG